MALEPYIVPIDPSEVSPEHIVSEHRVGIGLCATENGGQEHGVVIALLNNGSPRLYLAAVRLLTVEQASALGSFLLHAASQARALNAQAAEGKEGR